jgi:hypothetical protein
MHVPSGSASHHTGPGEPGEATLLAALADVSDALTAAIVSHDREAIVAATHDAEAIVAELSRLQGSPDAARPQPADADVVLLAARIEAAARRNALLLERAWAVDAAMLRLLAAAAKAESEGAGSYGAASTADPAQPAGWLDRSA